jgi:hypothetical protein
MPRDKTPPLPRFEPIPLQPAGEHHSLRPICGHWVDELDLEEVMLHLDPNHEHRASVRSSRKPCETPA